MELATKVEAARQVELLDADMRDPLYDSAAPLDDARASIDDVVRAAASRGWHIKRIEGYDPTKGGKPSYTWVFVSGDGTTEVLGEGYPLRRACLVALRGVLP